MLLVPFFAFITALGFAAFGIAVAATVEKIDQFNYVTTLFITPLFLVAGHLLPDRPAARGLPDRGPVQPALPAGGAGPRTRRFGFEATDLLRFAALVAFAVALWRVAVRRMTTRLID